MLTACAWTGPRITEKLTTRCHYLDLAGGTPVAAVAPGDRVIVCTATRRVHVVARTEGDVAVLIDATDKWTRGVEYRVHIAHLQRVTTEPDDLFAGLGVESGGSQS